MSTDSGILRAILFITIKEENRDVRSDAVDLNDFRIINTINLKGQSSLSFLA